MRAAVYQGTPFERRRAVHMALADAPGLTRDRRAWHLSAAAGGPDEAVATALVATADEARRRSGHSAAAAALRRAAELSPAEEDKVRRLVLAAESEWLAGHAARARALVDHAARTAQSVSARAAIAHLRGLFQLRAGVPADATDILLSGADLAYRDTVMRARALSAVGDLPHALLYAALGAATAGYLDQAGPQAAEGLQIARETGQETLAAALLAALAKVAALRGEEEECQSRARESLAMAIPRRLGLAVALASEALGLLDLGLGRPEEALHRFQMIATAEPGAGHPFVAMTTTSYLVEAAVRSDHRDVADRVAAQFNARAKHAAAGQLAIAAYCRALAGSLPSAGAGSDGIDQTAANFEEALRLLTVPMPFWRARIELSYGEHLRRGRRRRDARRHLRTALETFTDLGMTPWAARASTELRASGETARPRSRDGIEQLTPQELQIADFVSRGASNPDIAAQLFISRRTVEYHLRKVFQKLSISSRGELVQLRAPSGSSGDLRVDPG